MNDKFAADNASEMGNLLGVTRAIGREFDSKGSALTTPKHLEYMISLESAIDPIQVGEIKATHRTLEKMLREQFIQTGLIDDSVTTAKNTPRWKEQFTSAQWRAGAIVMAAKSDPVAYMRRACAMEALTPTAGVADFGISFSNSEFDYRPNNAALESFDARQLDSFMPFSVTYNIQSARQDEAGEALYPTVVLTPDQTGIEISVRRVQVHNEIRHSNQGKPTDFSRVNLIDAIRDHRILSNDTTVALPIWIDGDAANNASFSTEIAPSIVQLQGVDKKTAPLLPGIEVDLLGLANLAQVQPNGNTDQWDSLDLRLTLDTIYLKVTSTTGPATSLIKVSTKRLPYTGYYKSYEGLENDVNLNFISKSIPLAGTTKDTSGVVATALNYLTTGGRANWVVNLGIQMNGRGNLEFGTVSATPAAITIESIVNKNPDGSYTKITDAAVIAALKAELPTISIVGYELGAFRANLNRRSLGIICTTVAQRERHTIPLGAPITCASPLTQTATNTDVAAPITATRIRNSNQAITKLFEYAGQLESLHVAYDQRLPIPQIEGIGANLIKPYFEKDVFDVFTHVNSIKSQDRAADVSAALINKIREMTYRAYMNSNYQPALNAESGGVGETPQLIIVTDPVTMRHLLVAGDTRTASIGFDFQIIESQDLRMVGQIFCTFARKGQNGIDPLSFGFMAWIPELATNLPITRNGGTTQEIQVQPRTLHVNTLPILLQITVENLSSAVSNSVAVPFRDVV